MFKPTDRRFADLGFTKVYENQYGVKYERYIEEFNYIHAIAIMHKVSGGYIIQSYDTRVNSDCFNNVVGMSELEARLTLKKLKEMKKKYKWRTVKK